MHIMYLYHTGALKLQEMTFEEFIKFERASEFKHEFVSGKVIPLGEINAMAGAPCAMRD